MYICLYVWIYFLQFSDGMESHVLTNAINLSILCEEQLGFAELIGWHWFAKPAGLEEQLCFGYKSFISCTFC